jgi:rod shape determining protein RodA
MLETIPKKFEYDWALLIAVVFLLAFGLIAIFSLSLEAEREGFNNFQKQIVFLAIAIGFFILFSMIDYRIWQSYSGLLYVVGVLLLLSVLLFGVNIRGTTGWFNFGIFNIQPAEIMKLFLIISLARYFSKLKNGITPKSIIVSLIYVLIPVVLVALQPDMGSAVVMIVIWLGLLFFAGMKKRYLWSIVVLGVVFSFFAWGMILKDYQKTRILTFLDPNGDPLGSGYNVIQSIVAIGSGGISGKGLGHGSQSQLNFLPEKHTDFIYAAIAEESGLIGTGLILALFWILLQRMNKTIEMSKDYFGKLIVGGVVVMIFFQAFINIGMNLGIMPVAGLSLPLLSYGGSFLIVTLASLGLVQSVWKRRVKRKLLIDEALI